MKHVNALSFSLAMCALLLVVSCQKIQEDTPAPVKPSESNRRVSFTASDGNVYFLNATNGQRIWSNIFEPIAPDFLEPMFRGNFMHLPIAGRHMLTIDTTSKAEVSRTSGMRISTPLQMAGGLLLFGDLTIRSQYGFLRAMDSTGATKWGFSEGGAIQVGPAIQNEIAYVGNYTGKVYSVDVQTGKKRWELEVGNSTFKSDLVVGAGQLFVHPATFSTSAPSVDKLYAYSLTDQTRSWEFPISPSNFPLNTFSALTFDKLNELLYVISSDGRLYALNPQTGAKKWDFAAGNGFSRCPAVAGNVVYASGKDGKLYALDAKTGQKKWDFATGGPVSTTPTIANGVVFFGSEDKKCYAIDADTGAKKWESLADGVINTTPVVWTSTGRHIGFNERGGAATN